MEPVAVYLTSNQHPDRLYTTSKWMSLSTLAPGDNTTVDGLTVQPLYACRTPCVQLHPFVWPALLQ